MKRSDMTPAQQFMYDIGTESYAQGQKDALLSLAERFVEEGNPEAASATMHFLDWAEANYSRLLAEKNG